MRLIFLMILSFTSCSRVNVASKDHYYSNKRFRHGIVPMETFVIPKTNVVKEKIDQSSVTRGKSLYVKHCLSCHGESGTGNGPEAYKQVHPPSDLKKLVKDVADFKFFMSVSQWQADMPGWKEQFNEADREDLVAYIKSFR